MAPTRSTRTPARPGSRRTGDRAAVPTSRPVRGRAALGVLSVAALALAAGCASDDGPTATRSDESSTTEPVATSGSGADGAPDGTAGDEPETGGEPSDGTSPAGEGPLRWGPCEEPSQAAELECATLEVPVDHEAPDGDRLELAVARVPTSGGDRIGSLVLNPGGPGGSGLEFLEQAALIVSPEVAQRFDLVSFDPRGVGASTALDCPTDYDDDVSLVADDDRAAWDELLADTEDDLASCTPATLELAGSVGTNAAARDLDLLREALGDDGLSYVGYSYGTRLGATYAELFPERARALVLDGAVKPTTDFSELGRGQAAGFDRALEAFAEACDADADCVLRELGPALDVLEAVRAEADELGALPTDDPERALTPGELDLAVLSALYSQDAWPILAEALYVADATQDGTLLQVLADNYLDRRPDGTYGNGQVANGFVNCADDAARPTADEVWEEADADADASRWFGELLRASTGCLGIPAATDPLIVGPATGAPPILVIGSTGDPATPYEWSRELADTLDSGVLYTVEAEGHTAYGSIDCVADVVDAYLIDLEVPAEGGSCADDADGDVFVPVEETEFGRVLALIDCLREGGLGIPEVTLADLLADPTGEELSAYLDPADPDFVAALQGCQDEVAELQGG